MAAREKMLEGPSRRRCGTGPLICWWTALAIKLGGAGLLLVEKHGASRRCSWGKLHIGLDDESGEIVVMRVSSYEGDDGARTGALLDEITHPIVSLTADGGCDQARVYEAVDECHSGLGYRGAAFDGGLGRVRRDRS